MTKAWVEMLHRYLGDAVGVLIIALLRDWSLRAARRGGGRIAPCWATATLGWVCLQGAFGALTVTMKLYPAIVTSAPARRLRPAGAARGRRPSATRRAPVALPPGLRVGLVVVALLTVVQIALGGWVSTNYAVLACRDFPTCQGAWWPPMDFDQGFTLLRPLGASAGGGYLPFAALTAIHWRIARRRGRVAGARRCWRGGCARARSRRCAAGRSAARPGRSWQFASGLGNVVLGWPLAAAVAHTGGAAALVVVLTLLLVRMRRHRARRRSAADLAGLAVGALASADVRHACALRSTLTSLASQLRQFYALTKPRVVQLIVFCARHRHVARRRPALPDLADLRSPATARHLAGRRRGGGVQLPGRAAHRRADARAPPGGRCRAAS